MKKSAHLFQLIKSLSKSEKRSFKLFAKQYGKDGKNNYTFLFDALEKMHSYDHELLLRRVKKNISPATLPTIKVQLKKLILQSLRNSRVSPDIGFELRKMQDHIHILYEKGLYDQCHIVLQKAMDLAQSNEQFLFLDQLSILEYHLSIKQASIDGLTNYIENTFPSAKEARNLNGIQAEFEQLSAKMRILQLKSSSAGGYVSEEKLEEIISHPLMQLQIEEYPIVCQIDFHTIWGHYSYILSKKEATYHHYKKALSLIEQTNNSERLWLTHARFLLVSLSTFREFELFDSELARITERIQKTPAKNRSISLQRELDRTLSNIRFHRDLDQGNFLRIDQYKHELIALFDQSSSIIDGNLHIAFKFNMAYASLGNSHFKEALVHLNSILNTPEFKSRRIDVQTHSRILNICIHYELGNYDLIGSLVKSTKRYCKSQETLTPIVDSFLRFAASKLTQEYKEDFKDQFMSIACEWRTMIADRKNALSLEYVDFISWLETVYSNKSLEQVIKRQ